MEMYQRNDWVVPTFNGELRTDKPPLHYFLMQLSYRTFGVGVFSARLYAITMGILTVLCVYLFGRRLADERTALIASLILISSLQLAVQFHLAVPDPCLIFFLTLGYLSFIYAFQFRNAVYYYLFYFSIGLATLSKGPVAIVFAGLTVLIFLMAQKKFTAKTLLEIRLVQGVFIFLVIVLPWYVMVGIATQGEWIEEFFFRHNVGRFTSTMEGHRGFPLASFVIAVGALVPFSFFLPQTMRSVWHEQRSKPFLQFCLIAAGVILVFFAFSRTILPNYPEPALPFLAMLLGFYFSSLVAEGENMNRKTLSINSGAYLLVALVIPVAAWVGLSYEDSLRDLRYAAWYFSVLPLGALLGLYFIVKGKVLNAVYVYASSSVIMLLLFFYLIFPQVDRRNPVTSSVALIHKHEKPVLYYRGFNPAYVFALQRTIRSIGDAEAASAYSDSTAGYYLITQKRFLPDLHDLGAHVVFEGRDLFESQTTVVMEND